MNDIKKLNGNTVKDLIEYLQQLPGDTTVDVLGVDDSGYSIRATEVPINSDIELCSYYSICQSLTLGGQL